MSEQSLKVGIVGAGYWGQNLIRNCVALGILDSVCDIDARTLDATRASFPAVATLSDFHALLARRIDAVLIASPAQLHHAMCLEAIAAGKHVFVEKPLALTVDEGKQIAAAAQAAGLVVFVGHLLLYHPAIKKLRCMIAEGMIGRVWHLRSRRLSLGKLRSHENVWWSFAPHDVALMLAVMGEEPLSVVAAQSAMTSTKLCDITYADFEFSGDRSAHLEVCWLDPDKAARLDVFGDTGVLTVEDGRNGCSLIAKSFSVSVNAAGIPSISRGESRKVDFEADEPLKAEIVAFIEAVRTKRPFETSARHGVEVLKALSLAEEAARSGSEHRAMV
jgi:UDP-2-acetamido-3-amino-2,3-dideoxy-glucuronate N-acetyltransferase